VRRVAYGVAREVLGGKSASVPRVQRLPPECTHARPAARKEGRRRSSAKPPAFSPAPLVVRECNERACVVPSSWSPFVRHVPPSASREVRRAR